MYKNKHRFSSFSYAYRDDRNLHFAIQDVATDFHEESRVFVAEFDFSKFFDSISHEYLRKQYSRNGFFISDEEETVISAFLSSSSSSGRGVPQGTSISLFLANLACWSMDKNLEAEGVQFARYADDTLIWSTDYGKICKAFEVILGFSRDSGISINAAKSEGISLLVRDGYSPEIRSKRHVDFLGYSIGLGFVSIKENSIKKIQKEISYILYKNLVWPVKFSGFPMTSAVKSSVAASAGFGFDLAYLSSVSQIRRYLYGGLRNVDLFNYLNGVSRKINFKGLMSFYPLVNDAEQMRRMDGWLSSVIHRALLKRYKLLRKAGVAIGTGFPYMPNREAFLMASASGGKFGSSLYEIPSFTLINTVLMKGLKDLGIARVMNPNSAIYNYWP